MKISEWLEINNFYSEYDREEQTPLLKQYKFE